MVTQKIQCKKCGKPILPETAKRTNGVCMPCKQGVSKSMYLHDIEQRKETRNRVLAENRIAKFFAGLNDIYTDDFIFLVLLPCLGFISVGLIFASLFVFDLTTAPMPGLLGLLQLITRKFALLVRELFGVAPEGSIRAFWTAWGIVSGGLLAFSIVLFIIQKIDQNRVRHAKRSIFSSENEYKKDREKACIQASKAFHRGEYQEAILFLEPYQDDVNLPRSSAKLLALAKKKHNWDN